MWNAASAVVPALPCAKSTVRSKTTPPTPATVSSSCPQPAWSGESPGPTGRSASRIVITSGTRRVTVRPRWAGDEVAATADVDARRNKAYRQGARTRKCPVPQMPATCRLRGHCAEIAAILVRDSEPKSERGRDGFGAGLRRGDADAHRAHSDDVDGRCQRARHGVAPCRGSGVETPQPGAGGGRQHGGPQSHEGHRVIQDVARTRGCDSERRAAHGGGYAVMDGTTASMSAGPGAARARAN